MRSLNFNRSFSTDRRFFALFAIPFVFFARFSPDVLTLKVVPLVAKVTSYHSGELGLVLAYFAYIFVLRSIENFGRAEVRNRISFL